LPGEAPQIEFAEEIRRIPEAGKTPNSQRQTNRQNGYDEDLFRMDISIPNAAQREKLVANMVVVPIAESLRSQNPLLPKILYVDAKQTSPNIKPPVDEKLSKKTNEANVEKETEYLDFEKVHANYLFSGKRLPSAAEYEAIVRAENNDELWTASGQRAKLDDLFDGVAEWTTTKYDFPIHYNPKFRDRSSESHVLAGYGDPDKLPSLTRTVDGKVIAPPETKSPFIGYRGVRSGEPRFVKP
jgi:hypothetical protein